MGDFAVHRVFISYHHTNDQGHKATLLDLNERLGVFIDKSVDTGDIDPNLPDETIRVKIRDDYLRQFRNCRKPCTSIDRLRGRLAILFFRLVLRGFSDCSQTIL